MKTRAAFRFKSLYKAGILMLAGTCLYNISVHAQGDRRQQGEMREHVVRQPSIRQEATPNMNRIPSQGRPATAPNAVSGTERMNGINRPQRISDRPVTDFNRANNGSITRADNTVRPGNGSFNRPDNVNTRPDNINNRPGSDNFNRPDNINNRSGNVAYNRPGRDYNRPDYGNRPADYSNNGNRGYNDNGRHGYNNNGYKNYKRPVYNRYNPNWRYAYAPRRNSICYTLPSSYFSINFGGYGYRYYDGIFYRPYNNVFRVVAPPIGIFVNVLPFGYSRIYVNDYPYYYYNGTYYDHRNNNYVVVSPPVGAVVESLPDGYETVTVDGETYYIVDGAQYKPVMQANGEIWYEVIKAN